MKVHPSPFTVSYRATSAGFRKLLADAHAQEQRLAAAAGNRGAGQAVVATKSRPVNAVSHAKPMTVLPKQTPLTVAAQLAAFRAQAQVRAEALVEERADAFEATGRRIDQRELDLICRELLDGAANDERHELPTPLTALPADFEPICPGPAEPDVARLASSRARAALALARRIEVFLGSSGPALELPLTPELGISVRVERIGKDEVALTLKGDRGLPRAEAVARIREAMRARGLKIGALTIG